MQDTCKMQEMYPKDGIDSKAFLVCFLKRIPYMLLIGLTGAIIGSGLYLIIAAVNNRTPIYRQETEYYIDFAEGRYEARDYYNAFTWNDIMKTELILDHTMEVLGASYDKETVKNMITADILSDVRYLTVTVRGADINAVEAVSDAIEESLELLGSSKDEFDSIYQIRKDKAALQKEPLFTWRAALLGFLLGAGAEFFVFCVRFGMGEAFYTKGQIRKTLGIPVLGLWYHHNNDRNGIQELQTCVAMQEYEGTELFLINVLPDKNYAQSFLGSYEQLMECNRPQLWNVADYPIRNAETYRKLTEASGVLLVIPFGISCRNMAEDVLGELQRRNCRVLGAVLTQADPKWVRAYYAGEKRKV